jgi:hypothetical protein
MQSSTQSANTQLSSNLRERVPDEVLAILGRTDLLKGVHAQANLEVLIRFDESQIDYVLSALRCLSGAGLLSGEKAQVNFAVLRQGCQKFAFDIIPTDPIVFFDDRMTEMELFSRVPKQSRFQRTRRFVAEVACSLEILSEVGLLSGAQAQENFEIVMKAGGQCALYFSYALMRLAKHSKLFSAA